LKFNYNNLSYTLDNVYVHYKDDILYFVSPLGFSSLGQMSDKALRLTSLEHPLINIIAITLITIGWVKHKKLATSESKFKTFSIYYSLGLLLILSRIPWDLWF